MIQKHREKQARLSEPLNDFRKHDRAIQSVFLPKLAMGARFTECILHTDLQKLRRILLAEDRSNSITETSFYIVFFDRDNLSSITC